MSYDDEIYIKETDGVKVSFCQIEDDENLNAYYMCVENLSKQKLQLLGKDWKVSDAKGNVYSDSTPGFKGELVELESGEMFEMTAPMPIKSKATVLYGSCKVMIGNAQKDIPIPTFMMSNDNFANIANLSWFLFFIIYK